ncbi:MAG: peptidoglycan editing factor PgeF [Lachnospiraceae bacterium]|nr:peptidoglycan editing factor PgeF [Lachnospiraceae bacterium]
MQPKRKQNKQVMLQERVGKLEYLAFPILQKEAGIRHLFSTRLGGVSEGVYASMNLSYTRGDQKEAVDENFRRIGEVLGYPPGQFVLSDQTHTTNVRIVTGQDAGKGITRPKDYSDVDGLITNEPGIVLGTFFADCVPLYFYDPVKRVIALSHSGWRGTVGRMGQVTVNAMKRAFMCDPGDILAGVGPSICKDCYEVSADVADAFAEEFAEHKDEILFPKKDGKYLLDLWKANEIVLTEAGIRREHLEVTDICSCCNPEYLFSHRASKGRRGNLGAFLVLES